MDAHATNEAQYQVEAHDGGTCSNGGTWWRHMMEAYDQVEVPAFGHFFRLKVNGYVPRFEYNLSTKRKHQLTKCALAHLVRHPYEDHYPFEFFSKVLSLGFSHALDWFWDMI